MEKVRKERSDKRKDIKPFLSSRHKSVIYRISNITQTPVKDVAEYLCISALQDKNLLGKIAKFYKRDIRIDSTLYKGHINNPTIKKRDKSIPLERISLRLRQSNYNMIVAIAYALDCSRAKACATLIEHAIDKHSIMNDYVKSYLEKGLDRVRMNELQKVMQFINATDEKVENSWASLFSHIVDEVKAPVHSPQEIVDNFLIHHWRNK